MFYVIRYCGYFIGYVVNLTCKNHKKKYYLCRMEIRRINNGKIFCFGNDVIPKYSFNAKELDEETGMYYFEARYYRAPTFISRDPLMNEKPWLTPYHYCSNNPVGRIDPTGMMDDEYEFNQRGELLNVIKNIEKNFMK